MNHFLINGIERDAPLQQEDSFADLLAYIQAHYVNEKRLISAIRIDGMEISEREEQSLSSVPLNSLNKIEVDLAHPAELAQETLQILIPFSDRLSELAKRGEGRKLIEGLETFSESIVSVKQVLGITHLAKSDELELELLSILRTLLEAETQKDALVRSELLQSVLPEHLRKWREEGIPALIRSRDC